MLESNQKMELLLRAALDADEQELAASPDLAAGYQSRDGSWEVIVRYAGSLDALCTEFPKMPVTELYQGYAILQLRREQVEIVAQRPEILYMEKPKRLYQEVAEGKIASCITSVQSENRLSQAGDGDEAADDANMGTDVADDASLGTDVAEKGGVTVERGEFAGNSTDTIDRSLAAPDNYSGFGVLLAVIDSGIAWWHPDFRNSDGTTRILRLWDQTIEPDAENGWLPPQGYSNGVLFTAEVINEALGVTRPSGTADAAGTAGDADTANTANTSFTILNYTESMHICPSTDRSGHGTHVAGIAAGNGRASGGQYRGVAYEAELLIVKLGSADPNGFPNTIELMEAVNFCVQTALELNRPLCINLSYGNTYGSHSGTSLLETYLDDVALMGKIAICVGSGNEGADGGHVGGRIADTDSVGVVAREYLSSIRGNMRDSADLTTSSVQQFAVGDYESSLSIQIWKSVWDEIRFSVISPEGDRVEIEDRVGTQRYEIGRNQLYVYYGEPSPYQIYQEIYLELLPLEKTNTQAENFVEQPEEFAEIAEDQKMDSTDSSESERWKKESTENNGVLAVKSDLESKSNLEFNISGRDAYLTPGIWKITLQPQQIRDGRWSMWMPAGAQRGFATQFLQPAPDTTLTIPSTASRAITVGAYDAHTMTMAAFSGHGYTWNQEQIKPELVTPGVDIISCSTSGGYESRSGTSMATPFVTGSCAILMQYGIIDGHDPYLYGEKLKAALIRGAQPLPFAATYPNPETGWGALCLRKSL